MSEERKTSLHGSRYLVSVIGFSSVPRLITSILTLVSFPLVVRAVGPADYGVFVYVSALVNVLVLFADFGVASAAGKAIAEARLRSPAAARRELMRCARLQIAVGVVGLVPMLVVSWAIASAATKVSVDLTFLIVMVLASWISLVATFVRAALQSFLAFGWSAVLDSTESIARSAGWVLVAWLAPTYMGLGIATLATSLVAGILAIGVLLARARTRGDAESEPLAPPSSYRHLVRESVSFLGVGLATRVFLSVPFVIFGQLLGAEVVGVIGAFTRLLDIVSFPFIVIGNALAVRAHEVKSAGLSAVVALWDACCRFVVIAAGATGAVLLSSGMLARLLIPESAAGPMFFGILSIVILTHSTSCFVATTSDFVGGLRKRILFLSVLTLVEIPLLWVFARVWLEPGAVVGYALVQVLMIGGYIVIARRVFFAGERYRLPGYIARSFGVVATSLVAALVLQQILVPEPPSADLAFFAGLGAYAALVGIAFVGFKDLRRRFLSLAVFEFTRS